MEGLEGLAAKPYATGIVNIKGGCTLDRSYYSFGKR